MKINSSDSTEDGLNAEDSMSAVKLLENLLDGVEVSGNWHSFSATGADGLHPFFKDYTAALAETVSIPVILTGGNRDYQEMQEILRTTKIAYFALARPLICEPDLIGQWQSDPQKKPKCISCNRCFNIDGKNCVFHAAAK